MCDVGVWCVVWRAGARGGWTFDVQGSVRALEDVETAEAEHKTAGDGGGGRCWVLWRSPRTPASPLIYPSPPATPPAAYNAHTLYQLRFRRPSRAIPGASLASTNVAADALPCTGL